MNKSPDIFLTDLVCISIVAFYFYLNLDQTCKTFFLYSKISSTHRFMKSPLFHYRTIYFRQTVLGVYFYPPEVFLWEYFGKKVFFFHHL